MVCPRDLKFVVGEIRGYAAKKNNVIFFLVLNEQNKTVYQIVCKYGTNEKVFKQVEEGPPLNYYIGLKIL